MIGGKTRLDGPFSTSPLHHLVDGDWKSQQQLMNINRLVDCVQPPLQIQEQNDSDKSAAGVCDATLVILMAGHRGFNWKITVVVVLQQKQRQD